MGNSTPVAFVTKDIEEDAVKYALEHYNVI